MVETRIGSSKVAEKAKAQMALISDWDVASGAGWES